MKDRAFQMAGTALVWKAVQLAGVKGIFVSRLLILARLLSPEEFGLLAIAVTAIGLLLSVTDFGMVPALIQGTHIERKHYNTAWTVNITRALVIGGCVFIGAPAIAAIFDESRVIPIIQVIALRPLLDAAASIKLADLERNLQFRPLAIAKLMDALANTIVAIALARRFGVWGLVAGTLAGSALYLLISYLVAPHRPRLSLDYTSARSLIRFGRWIFLTSLIVTSGSYVLRVVISRQLGAAALGLYFLGAQLAFLPAEVASEVVGSVAFPLLARLQSDIVRTTQAFRTTLMGTSALLFPVCALIIALAPTLVQDILGPRWEGTVPVIRILALVSMIGVFGEAAVPILKGLGQPHKVTVLEAVQSLMIIVFVWGLAGRYGLGGAAFAWLPAIIVSQFFSAVFVQKILIRPLARLGSYLLVITVASVVGAVVALTVTNALPGLAGIAVGCSLAVVFVGTVLWATDRRLALGLANNLGRVFPQVAALVGYVSADS